LELTIVYVTTTLLVRTIKSGLGAANAEGRDASARVDLFRRRMLRIASPLIVLSLAITVCALLLGSAFPLYAPARGGVLCALTPSCGAKAFRTSGRPFSSCAASYFLAR